jgi:hypothetical protein
LYEYLSVTRIVQELGWLPLEKRRQITRLVNFHNGQAGWSLVPGVNRGVYFCRGDHSFKVARVGSRRDVGRFSFANRTGKEWSSLPQELVELEKMGTSGVSLIASQ